MVDFHMHVLPGVDHGSGSLSETIEMLRGSAASGVTSVVASPHFYPNTTTVEKFVAKRERAYQTVLQALPDDLKHVNIIKAAEVMICPEIENMEGLEKLCIGDTKFILLEMPYVYWTEWVFHTVYEIISKRNLAPIIAHIERYVSFHNDMDNISALLQMDVLAQMNASSICNFASRRAALKFIGSEMAQVIGSDRHSAKSGDKDIQKALKIIKRKFGDQKLNYFINNSKEILKNQMPHTLKPTF